MASTSTDRGRTRPAQGGYTLVTAQGSDGYVAPHAPDAPANSRYMAVRRVLGGAWGIVDRRRGRLIEESHPGEHTYAAWGDVQAAARALNQGRQK